MRFTLRRPVVLLTFANDRYGPSSGYLRDLIAEQRAIDDALSRGPATVVVRANVTLDDLFDLFARYNDRIVAWHHGGHADADAVFLEDDSGQLAAADVASLATRLGQLPRLALIVLNGCSTSAQVTALRRCCTAPIVATDRAIADSTARAFAERFYDDLADDRPIDAAFESAGSRLLAAGTDGASLRMLRPGMQQVAGDRLPWQLHVDPERPMTARWRLSDARHGPWLARRIGLLVGGLLLVGGGILAATSGSDAPPSGCIPSPEQCNGIDDDCDDAIDEASDRSLCVPFGFGRRFGEAACVDGACRMTTCPGGWHDRDELYITACEYACSPTGPETCDGRDEDCDGRTDEDFGQCDLGCDGRDDDGDGRSDEGCPITRCGAERHGTEAVPPCNGCPDGVEVPAGFVCIPPGEGLLGEREDRRRTVRFERPFLIMVTELTVRQWADVARGHAGTSPSLFPCPPEAEGRCPVERVNRFEGLWWANRASIERGLTSCYDRMALATCHGGVGRGCQNDNWTCHWMDDASRVVHCPRAALAPLAQPQAGCSGLRLPTADEWEYAARAGATTRYVGGDGIDALEASAWFGANSADRTHAVGQRAPNRWGLYDVSGNVSEWVHDEQAHWRGGDFTASASMARLSSSGRHNPALRSCGIGLRFVRAVPGTR